MASRRPAGGRNATSAAFDHEKEVAKAERELARAEARAEAARARVARVRWRAWSLESPDADDGAFAGSYDDDEPLPETSNSWQPPRLQLPGRKAGALAAACVIVGASLGASMFMELEHRALTRTQHRSAEFEAAAREGVIRLMSIDANHAEEDIQRNIDNSTGELRQQLRVTGWPLAQQVAQSKMSTTAIVDAVAVESTTADSGIILVLARSDSFNPDDGERVMKTWRISVKVTRVGDQLKLAKVDFLQ
ncbi:hypothetical protein [Mycobacterium bourgelatii]|uniref:Mce associated membrane protein n=1 Tax=Mycobacterium bourgelatii TaxID=1273442 RepID=A0A7I9YVZ3_MYCBU|nr:hypothetical protein [Mycobacterium bourgelatii]MCV6975189.1 hypothetical protein [Mycobacterium bourgelatii]GFG92772.1 hypothetical protein MBOU_48140 [Mycobacterium bourgelatii]